MKIKLVVGAFMIILFGMKLYTYISTNCITPDYYEPVCGQSALIVLGVYAIVALLGVYLIVTSIKRKDDGSSKKN